MTEHCLAIGSAQEPKKFFNRKTQGFTDTSPGKDSLYTERGAKRLYSSGEPQKIWRAMVENAPDLVFWMLSVDSPRIRSKQITSN